MSRYQPHYTEASAEILLQDGNVLQDRTELLHNHDYYEFFLIEEGRAIHHINGQYSIIERGTLSLIRPHDVHGFLLHKPGSYRMINVPFSEDTARTVFSFVGDAAKGLLTSPQPPTVLLKEETLQALSARLHMIDAMDASSVRGAHFRACLVEVLMCFLPPSAPEERFLTPPVWMQKLLSELENAVLGGHEYQTLFSDTGVSYEHISRSFHRYLGVTPSEHINSLRLKCAAQRLRTEPYTDILDIALECGFGNLSYFYRCFKKRYGISPGKYRRKYVDINKQNAERNELP